MKMIFERLIKCPPDPLDISEEKTQLSPAFTIWTNASCTPQGISGKMS